MLTFEILNMQLMDVVTTYLYGDLDTDIYMKVHRDFRVTAQIDPSHGTLSL